MRQLDKRKVDRKILCLYYNFMISSVTTYVISSWYNRCSTTLLHQLAWIEKQAAKLIRKQDHKPILMPASVYKSSATASTKKIMADPQHPLHIYFKWLPSRIRLSTPYCSTNLHKDTAVPPSMKLVNENIARSTQDESKLELQ